MKKTTLFHQHLRLAVAGAALILSVGSMGLAHADEQAQIVSLQGGVFVRRAGEAVIRPVKTGARLKVGDMVVSGVGGEAVLRVAGREVRLGPTSELEVKPPEGKKGLWATITALFGSDDEALPAVGGIRSGQKSVRVLEPRGPIETASPVVRWEAQGLERFTVKLRDTRGFAFERTVTGRTLSLSEHKVTLAPGRYYVTVQSAQAGDAGRRHTVFFDVAEVPPRPVAR